jgi:hypothetical protein
MPSPLIEFRLPDDSYRRLHGNGEGNLANIVELPSQ